MRRAVLLAALISLASAGAVFAYVSSNSAYESALSSVQSAPNVSGQFDDRQKAFNTQLDARADRQDQQITALEARVAALEATASPTPTPAPSATPTPTQTPAETPTPEPTSTATPAPTPAGPAPGEAGIAAGANLPGRTDADLGQLLDEMVRAGAKWVRFDVAWSTVQAAGATSYDWASFDRVVSFIQARGMKAHLILAYTPAWARCSSCGSNKYPPSDPQTYATFAQKAAEHYGPMGVHVYEVWNEPNISGFWQPSPNVAAYTAMLKLAYPAIKAGDPDSTVLTGGTAPAACCPNVAPVDFLRGVYTNGGGGSFDAVAHHPYTWPAHPGETQTWNAWAQMADTFPSLRSVMVDNGDEGKRIWMTEFGAPTNGPSGSYVSEAEQANMATLGFQYAESYPWAGPLEWYSHRDLGTSTSTRENFFGLLRNDWTQKPSFGAYQASHP